MKFRIFDRLPFDDAPERPPLPPEVAARFRLPVGEVLSISILMALQIVAWLGIGIVLIAYFAASWLDTPWVLPVAGLLGWFGVLRALWLGSAQRPDGFFLLLSEIFAGVVLIRLLFLLIRPDVGGLSDGALALDTALMMLGYSQGRVGGYHFYRLYLQAWEVAVEDGGMATNKSDGRYFVDHYNSYLELKQRWITYGLLVVTLLGVALFLLTGNDKPGAAQDAMRSILLLALIYFVAGLPLLSLLRLRYLRTGWRLRKLDEPRPLVGRWPLYVLGLVLVALLVAALLPHSTDLNPFAWIGKLQGQPDPNSNREMQRLLDRLTCADTTNNPRCTIRETMPPVQSDLIKIPPWVEALLLSAIAAAIIFGALYMLERSGLPLPRFRKFSPLKLLRDFWAWLRSLFAPRTPLDAEDPASRRANLGDLLNRFRRERMPDDARGQVRYHYRHTLERASRAGYARPSGMTPDEYRAYLNPKLGTPELEPDMNNLTQLYDEARFSPHPIDHTQANTAADATKRLTQYLRRIKKESETK